MSTKVKWAPVTRLEDKITDHRPECKRYEAGGLRFELIQNGPKSTEIIWIYDMALDSIFMRYLALGMEDIIGESCEQGLRYLGEIMDNLS